MRAVPTYTVQHAVAALMLGCAIPRASRAQDDGGALPRYELAVTIDPAARRLAVSGSVWLPAGDAVRDSLALAMSEMLHDVHVEIVSPRASAGPVRLDSVLRPHPRPGWGTVTWRVHPARAIAAAEPVLLRFSAAAEARSDTAPLSGNVFSVGRRAAFGAGITTAWYPELEEREPHPAGRLRGLRGTGTITFTVPPAWRVYSGGRPLPAPPHSTDDSALAVFRFRSDRPTYFSFAAGPYTVTTEPADREHRGRALPTAAFFLTARPAAAEYARRSLQVLHVLEREFGPYPFDRFAIVEVPTGDAERAGFAGASVDGFILSTSEFLDRPFNTAYYGHEIGHQWWAVTVRPTGTRGLWMLSEGMAQYGSLRAVEAVDGPAAAERYRRIEYPGYFEQGGRTYFRLAAAGLDAPLADLPVDGALSRLLVGSKGFLVWDLLAQEVGRERFRSILAGVVRRFTTRRLAWDDFLAAVSTGAGRDLSSFYHDWFDRPGVPDWRISGLLVARDTLRGSVVQAPPPFGVTVAAVVLRPGCAPEPHTLRLEGAETTFRLPLRCRAVLSGSARSDSVVLDPHFQVIHWTPEVRAEAQALAPYTRAEFAYAAGREDAEQLARSALDTLAAGPAEDVVGLGFRLHYLLAQILTDGGRLGDARAEIDRALRSTPKPPDVVPLVFLQLARVAKAQGDTAALRDAVAAAVRSDAAVHGLTGAAELARALLPDTARQQ